MEKPKLIATHSGKFHVDDVIAITLLKMIYPDVKVIRTRNSEEFEKADLRVDVCGRYNPEKGDFDHHQPEGAGERENGIPYASAGLIWKHFGEKLVSSKEALNKIDERIMQYVDADDVGMQTYKPEKLDPYKIREIVLNYNPTWKRESNELFDKRFFELVDMFSKILRVEIERVEDGIEGSNLVNESIENVKEGDKYLIFERSLPWKREVVEKTDLLYVVSYNSVQDNWAVLAVPKTMENVFDYRKKLPSEWGGLNGEDLQKVTGVPDAVFCHSNLFLLVVKSKEGAIKLVEKALAA